MRSGILFDAVLLAAVIERSDFREPKLNWRKRVGPKGESQFLPVPFSNAKELMEIVRSRRRTTVWNMFFQYFTVVYALISGIVLVPLYLTFIPLELYGNWLATGNIIAWIVIVDPGLSTALMQRTSVAYGGGDTTTLNGLITSGVTLSGAVAGIILIVGLIMAGYLPNLLAASGPELKSLSAAFYLAVVGTSLTVFSYGVTAINMGLQSSLGIGLVSAVSTLSSLLLTVVLLYEGAGLLAIPAALMARGAALIAGNVVYLVWRIRQERIPYRPSLAGSRFLLGLMSFTFIGQGLARIAANVDVLFVARQIGPEAAAAFALTRKAPDLSRTVLDRPATAFMPAIASLVGAGELSRARAVLVRLLSILVWLTGLAVVGFLGFNRAFVGLWVGGHLFAGYPVNVAIVLSLALAVLASTLASMCYALGDIKANSLVWGAYSVLVLPLMYFGSKYYGILGVALSQVVGLALVGVGYFPWRFAKLTKLSGAEATAMASEFMRACLAAAAALLASLLCLPSSWASFVACVVGACTVYALVLAVVSNGFRRELRSVADKVRARVRPPLTPS